jgi:hypothetical protein
MERIDKIHLKATVAEIRDIVKGAIIAQYPSLAAKPITVDTKGLMDSIPEITIEIQTADPTTVTL